MAKAVYKVEFNKFRSGQTHFTRSITLQQIEVLFISCNNVTVKAHSKKKVGQMVLTFYSEGDFTQFVKFPLLPYWVLKRFLPVTEWKQLD